MSNIHAMPITQSFRKTRAFTEQLAAPLSAEDCMIQSMDDASPVRWHLAHTTWFFETFILREDPDYRVFDDSFNVLFNSYYNTIGEQFLRGQRGLISRPGLEQIRDYRRHVDSAIQTRLEDDDFMQRYSGLLGIGLQHEQQHQELILTDIKHVLSCNPAWPSYRELEFACSPPSNQTSPWLSVDEGVFEVGHEGGEFAFDNEYPRHKIYLHSFELNPQLVTCGQFQEFIDAGGYKTPDHWLSEGWATVQQSGWDAPMYWHRVDDQWMQFTLSGLQPINPDWPVTHVSLFEADAYARWAGCRLPTEQEWETLAVSLPDNASAQFVDRLVDSHAIHPTNASAGMSGGVWQWTSSSYSGYPGYRPPSGAVGEYNGKFMCNQYVLRGGSVATHSNHIRTTYRNFFPAKARWQFSGIRTARSWS